jgi:hypothetical protein
MDFIKHMVWQHKDRVSSSEEPAAEVTLVLFEHARDFFLDIIRNRFKHKGKIVLLGGIQINAEPRDYFEPKIYSVFEPNGDE